MCMSVGEHPKNEDLRVHRQPSEETKEAQKENNKEFEVSMGHFVTILDNITFKVDAESKTLKIDTETTETKENTPKNSKNEDTQTTPVSTTIEQQKPEQNTTEKPTDENISKTEVETKTNEPTEQKAEKEEKPSFKENMSEIAKGFANKIGGFFSTAVEKIKEVSHNLQPEVREYNKLEHEKERLVEQSQKAGIMLPQEITQTQPGATAADIVKNIETIKNMMYNNRLDAWNRISEFKHGQDIVDRIYELRSDLDFHAGGFDAVQSPAEIFARQSVDRIPNSEVREELNKFYEFEKMYETIYSFIDTTTITLEDTKDIEKTYIAELLDEGKSFSDIYLDLSADLRMLAENNSPSII